MTILQFLPAMAEQSDVSKIWFADVPLTVTCNLTKCVTRPGRCGHCQQPLLFVGLCCKYCSFRCHVKCGDSQSDKCVYQVCSLSKISKNTGKGLAAALEKREINRNHLPTASCSTWAKKSSGARPKSHGSYCRFRHWFRSQRSEKRRLRSTVSEPLRSPVLSEPFVVQVDDDRSSAVTSILGGGSFCSTQERPSHLEVPKPHPNLVATCSCPSPKTARAEATPKLISYTWPRLGRSSQCNDIFNDDDDLSSVVGYHLVEEIKGSQQTKDSLSEWYIPYEKLEFLEIVRRGCQSATYRGRWHGDVTLHKFTNYGEDDANSFWDEVKLLTRIRHENIALFMGVCVEPSNLTIVTSVRKGESLHHYIHQGKQHIQQHVKLSIIRQIAQGMSYLHAKGIILKRLNSKNIFLETKVKICIVDCAMVDENREIPDCGVVAQSHLSYYSPELLSRFSTQSPYIPYQMPYTKESDIYAFGTVIYEVLSGTFPFHHQQPHAVLWQVCTGRRQSLDKLKVTGHLKTLITDCWAQEQIYRPEFSDILKDLQNAVSSGIHKKHSSSEPENLNRINTSPRLSYM